MTFHFPVYEPGLYAAIGVWLSLSIWIAHLPERNRGVAKWLPVLLAAPVLLGLWMLIPSALQPLGAILTILLVPLLLVWLCKLTVSDAIYYSAHALLVARVAASIGWQELYTVYLGLSYHYDYQGMSPISPEQLQMLEIACMGVTFVLVFSILFVVLHLRRPVPHNAKGITVLAALAFFISFLAGNVFSWFDQSFFAVAVSDAAIFIRSIGDFLGLTMLIGLEEMARKLELNRELSETYRVLERQNEQYRQYRANDEAMRRLYHDMKHQIAFARTEPDAEKREKHLADLDRIVRRHESAITTGNSVLDTLLSGKNQSCLENGITMTVFADAAGLDFVNTMDLCSIFGNALDNAIECEERISDPEKRLIKVEITPKNAIYYIKIDNYCETAPEFLDGFPVTTKEDARFHGFGVRSIQKAAEKYGGHSTIRWDRNWFSLTILLPNPA